MTPQEAYDKAVKAGKRMPDLEHIILTDPVKACNYAMFVIKARWEEAEDIILTNLCETYQYAKHVIKDKLPPKMHNRMLFYAMRSGLVLSEDLNDSWVKQYFEFIELKENIKKLTVDQIYDKLMHIKDYSELEITGAAAAERMNELSDDYLRNLITHKEEIKYMLMYAGVKIPK